MDRKIYHTGDLAVVWNIGNRNTLYKTIGRHVKNGVLIPIYKGLYATIPLGQLSPLELGKAVIHQYAYLTTETVLAQAGVISQAPSAYTFAAGVSKKVSVGPHTFLYRQLKDEFLFNPAGIAWSNGTPIASLERAAADLLYFSPRYHFDIPAAIDAEKLRAIQKEVGYPCK